jgi:hypothetical protein
MKKRFLYGLRMLGPLLISVLLLLGIPSSAALAASRGEGEPPIASAGSGGIDLSALQPYTQEAQQLLGVAAAGLPIAFLVWLTTNAVTWVGLIKADADDGKYKRRWALGSGICFGIYASLAALATNMTTITALPLILALLDGIIRGVAAGIVAAFVYEAGSALLARGKTT